MATHIIASTLPPKKAVEFANYRVVKPAWVTDSIQAGKLLSWTDYRVIEDGPRQKTIQFDGGKMVSQATAQQSPRGYREQSQNSFYTSQFQKSQMGGSSPFQPSPARKPTFVPADPIQDDDAIDFDVPGSAKVAANLRAQDLQDTEVVSEIIRTEKGAGPSKPSAGEGPGPTKTKPLTSEEHNALLLSDPHIRKSSAANPDFLKQYFSESRLHHLSAWKAQLKARLQNLGSAKGSPSKPAKRRPDARRYIMHVDFDCCMLHHSLPCPRPIANSMQSFAPCLSNGSPSTLTNPSRLPMGAAAGQRSHPATTPPASLVSGTAFG